MNPKWETWTKDKISGTSKHSPTWFCPLHDFGLITATGKDVSSFLNNQLSNDLAKVSNTQAQLSAYCNPKGRMYCGFMVFLREDQQYCLRTTATLVEAVLQKLQMYVLRADVQLASSKLAGLGIGGANAADIIQQYAGQVPDDEGAVIHHQAATIIRAFGSEPRYEIYAPTEQLMTWWEETLQQTAQATDPTMWRQYDILSGIPNLYPETSERFVPQMLNFDLLGGVSFSKGCYPGQEVVSRTHYLGKLKRRMYHFSSAQTQVPIGTPIFVPAYSANQPSGEVIDTYLDTDNTLHGLAVLRLQGLESDTAYFDDNKNATITLESMPYEVSPESIDPEKIT